MGEILKQELALNFHLRVQNVGEMLCSALNLREDKVADYKIPIDYVYFISNNNLYAEADSSD